MKRLPACLLALSLFMASAPAIAGPPLLNGEVAEERVAALTSQIPWYNSFPEAERAAQKQGKLIFFVQMLGHLDGAT